MKTSRKKTIRPGAVRRLTRTGTYTFYVTIPKRFIEDLEWEQGRWLLIRRNGKRVVIEAAPRRR